MRTGILAEKVGMTRIFAEDGSHIPVTLLKASGNTVIDVKTEEADGYNAVRLGYGAIKSKNVTKPLKEFYAKKKVEAKRKVREFRVDSESLAEAGKEISVAHFVVGQKVDVFGVSKGKGFSGAMKRHNFGGLEATHGVSISHRSHGSTGHCQEPGKVFKGKKMAGQYGDKRVAKQNLKVVHIDEENGLIAVKGAVPGSKGSVIEIKDAVKVKLHEDIKSPVVYKEDKSAAKKGEAKPSGEVEVSNESENAAE